MSDEWDRTPKKRDRRVRLGSDDRLAILVGAAIAGVLIYLAVRQ